MMLKTRCVLKNEENLSLALQKGKRACLAPIYQKTEPQLKSPDKKTADQMPWKIIKTGGEKVFKWFTKRACQLLTLYNKEYKKNRSIKRSLLNSTLLKYWNELA